MEFPSLKPGVRLPAQIILTIDETENNVPAVDVARDISILQISEIPAQAAIADISPKPVAINSEHVYGGYPMGASQLMTGPSIPAQMGACTFNFETTTSPGDSGGPVYDERGLFVGVTLHSDNMDTQGRFVSVDCFAEKLGTLANVGETASSKLKRLLKDVQVGFVPPAFYRPIPSLSEYVFNIDLMRFVEESTAANQIDDEMFPYLRCPIGQAIFDRLTSDYWDKFNDAFKKEKKDRARVENIEPKTDPSEFTFEGTQRDSWG